MSSEGKEEKVEVKDIDSSPGSVSESATRSAPSKQEKHVKKEKKGGKGGKKGIKPRKRGGKGGQGGKRGFKLVTKRSAPVAPKREESVTLSFGVLDDLEWKCDCCPRHVSVKKDLSDLRGALDRIFARIREDKCHYGTMFLEEYESYRGEIVAGLVDDGYWVLNRYDKYYAVAFALDFTSFLVYSKDCDAELIDWRIGAEDKFFNKMIKAKVVRQELPPDYHESPVIKFVQQVREYQVSRYGFVLIVNYSLLLFLARDRRFFVFFVLIKTREM